MENVDPNSLAVLGLLLLLLLPVATTTATAGGGGRVLFQFPVVFIIIAVVGKHFLHSVFTGVHAVHSCLTEQPVADGGREEDVQDRIAPSLPSISYCLQWYKLKKN